MPELEGIGLRARRLGVGGHGLDVRFHRPGATLAGPVIRSDVVAGLRGAGLRVDGALVDRTLVVRPRPVIGSGRGVRRRQGIRDLAGAGVRRLGSVRCLRLVARRLASRLCLLPVTRFT
ncbi:hypothetical protein ASE25_05370 [Terrabacter sp. Root85]|nr:hypothetical protein ASE25_05370 [Terrabacter sp. Root85]